MSPAKIAYLVHDLTDASVGRRVELLASGGSEVALAGFYRGEVAPGEIAGLKPLALRRTHDAKMLHRIGQTLSSALFDLEKLTAHVGASETIVARNLEMLLVASRLANRMERRPRLVYECIDLHRLLVANGGVANAVRLAEKRLRQHVDLVLTSSPAFIERHFQPEAAAGRVVLVENKLPAKMRVERAAPRDPGPPWRIGWFGALRCRRSFELLSELCARSDGRVEVVMRGRPSPAVFEDLAAEVAERPHMRFEGPYRYPDDLTEIYGEVHFAWCLDFYEEGLNSTWLLPNRIYECCYSRTVPIALAGVETARKLDSLGIGTILDEATPQRLDETFAAMTAQNYAAQIAAIDAHPVSNWKSDRAEYREIVDAISGQAA